MDIKFQTALLFVKDIKVSSIFYQKILEQKIEYDFGADVVFHGGFAIHDADHISNLLFGRANPNSLEKLGRENLELYFESESLEEVFVKLEDYGVKFIHTIREQPWGQRVLRFYDPDDHIVEIGEPMSAVIRRYLKQGASEAEVASRTSMPIEEIAKIRVELDKTI